MNFSDIACKYENELLNSVVPFWQKHSPDTECGGYFTCLDRDGTVYDTDKFVWLQCRQVWLFSMLYNRCEKKSEWLETAKLGADFLSKHGADREGNWYFALDRRGNPLIQPYNIFSDFFAAMAFCQYGLATEDQQYTDFAVKIYKNILRRKDNPKGIYNKQVAATRSLHSMGFAMIMANLALEMEKVLSADELERTLEVCVHEVLGTSS